MKILFPMAIALTTLSLVACTEGGDVYVSDPGTSSASSAAALECAIVPGASVCDRTIDGVTQADHGRVLDALQAVSDFVGITESTRNELEEACRAIVAETSGASPTVPSISTPRERLRIVCSAAHDAIIAAEHGVLRIEVRPSSCPEAPVRTCSAPVNAGVPPCDPSTVTVSTPEGASAVTAAVGAALSHHVGVFFTVKGRFETLASITRQLTANADALGLLPSECIASSTRLVTDAQSSVDGLVASMSAVADAATSISR